MSKIAVIGGRDTVLCFKALGMTVAVADTDKEAKQAFKALTKEGTDVAVIYVQESYADVLKTEIAGCQKQLQPAVILIPGREGSLGIARSRLREAVELATGSDLLGVF